MKAIQFLDLTFTHAWASIRSEARQTTLGYLWWLLDPLLFIGVYYLVFGVILKSKTDDFIVFLIIGILAFQWFQMSITQGAATIHSAGALIKQVKLPKAMFPLSKILHNFWQFLFVFFAYALVVYLFLGQKMTVHLVALPAVILAQLVLTTGLSLVLAVAFPFFPDIKHVLQPVLRGLLFVSGVFFPVSKVPDELRFFFFLNPMALLIEAYRACVLRHEWPGFTGLGILVMTGVMLIVLGSYLINRLDASFAKAIP